MDCMHDLGGVEGFSAVKRSAYTGAFEYDWELKIHAIGSCMLGKKCWGIDEQRHAIERMEPRHYMTASYYERQLTGFLSLTIEKQLCDYDELRNLIGTDFPLSRPAASGRQSSTPSYDFQPGQRVRVKNEFVSGHTRFPGYARGKVGTVLARSAVCHFPDASGHGLDAALEMTYDIRFEARDLWPDSSDDAQVHFTAFESYLELAEEADHGL